MTFGAAKTQAMSIMINTFLRVGAKCGKKAEQKSQIKKRIN